MKLETPAAQNPIDQMTVVGQPLDRFEAKLKTTGTATYSYEYHNVAPNIAYGYILGAAISGSSAESVGELMCAPSQEKLDSDTDRACDKLHQRHFVRTRRSLAR